MAEENIIMREEPLEAYSKNAVKAGAKMAVVGMVEWEWRRSRRKTDT